MREGGDRLVPAEFADSGAQHHRFRNVLEAGALIGRVQRHRKVEKAHFCAHTTAAGTVTLAPHLLAGASRMTIEKLFRWPWRWKKGVVDGEGVGGQQSRIEGISRVGIATSSI